MLRAITIAAAVTSTAGWASGNDDPDIARMLENMPTARGNVTYHTPASLRQLGLSRFLQGVTQQYGGFVPLSTLHANGGSAPIRISLVWDPVDAGDTVGGKKRMCTVVGETITVQSSSGSDVLASNFCKDTHIVSSTSARGILMRQRTADAMQFWMQTLRIRPVLDPHINISTSVVNAFALTTTSMPNTDLIVIMTARPSPNKPVAGYASCMQRDQYNRCTVGWFNWVPELLNVEKSTSPDVIGSEMHTALHELTHVFGGMNPGRSTSDTTFIDNNGNPVTPFGNVYTVETDAGYNKPASKIITPRVLNVSRTAFDCPTMTGFPLEDMPLGVGSHWEARLAGPEYMSYGSGSGQTYISDLTLAFLEDTNQYIANYSMAGKITPDAADDFAGANLPPAVDTTYTPPRPRSKGFLTWGRGEGCAFVNGHPRTWPPRYICKSNQAYSCTPDNRMAAVCIVKGDYASEPSCSSYGDLTTYNGGTGTYSCSVANTANGGIPPKLQFFQTDDEARAAIPTRASATVSTTGGFSAAMDYVPVNVGYWDCTTREPSTNASGSLGGEGGGLGAFASLFGSASDMSQFGGQVRARWERNKGGTGVRDRGLRYSCVVQARCPECRCFQSSLLELTKSINPLFPVYGLCYRKNCYRPDYLQIAIKGQLSTSKVYWYKCPTAGGKLYIPGFSGAFHCPAAEQFCAMETISGVKYTEENIIWSAIFWGITGGGSVLLMLICAFPCCRDALIRCSKRTCGATRFQELDALEGQEITKFAEQARVKGIVESWILLGINTLSLMVGFASVGLVAYAIYTARLFQLAVPMLGISVLIVLVSGIGVIGARAKAAEGPSCWLLTYFFTDLIMLLVLIWGIAYNLAYSSWTSYVDRYWDEISDVLPSKYQQGNTRQEQIASATKAIQDNLAVLAGLAIAVLVIYLIALLCAARLIRFRTLVSMTLAVLNNAFMVFGGIMAVVGFYLLAGRGRAAGIQLVIAIVLAVGLLALVIGIVGTVGVFKKKNPVLILYMVMQVLATGLLAYGVYLFVSRAYQIEEFINQQDDDQLARIASDLGLSMSKQQIIEQLQDTLNQLALACAVVIAFTIILFVCAIIYVRTVHRERIVLQNKNLRQMREEDLPGEVPRSNRDVL